MQGHYILGQVPSFELQSAIHNFGELGLEVAITELDIRIPVPLDLGKLTQQNADYYSVTRACVEEKSCIGMTVWDYTDKYRYFECVFPLTL